MIWGILKHNLLKGYACLAIVVAIWTASGYLTQGTFTQYNYENSIAIPAYSTTVGLVLLLPLAWRKVDRSDLPTFTQMGLLGTLWLIGQLLYLLALLYTSMGTVTAVVASSTAFSFLFSVVILKYDFRIISALSVLVTIAGVTLTACFKAEAVRTDDSEEMIINETVHGIVVGLASAVVSGLFNCLFKKWVKDDTNSGIVFGSFGIVGIFVGIPVIVISHYTGIQEFQMPGWQVAVRILGDAVMCSVVCNYFFSKTFIYLTPVIISVGLTMTIPIAFVITALILKTHSYPPMAILGGTLIFLAVIAVSYDQAKYEKELSLANQQEVKSPSETLVVDRSSIQ
jgi:drug/metabolite transporter (DMT)-like permease